MRVLPFALLAFGLPAAAAPLVVGAGTTTISSASTFDSVTVQTGGILVVDAPITVTGNVDVQQGGLVTHDAKNATGVSITASGTFAVEPGGTIDVSAKGFGGGNNGSAFGGSGETVDPVTVQVVAGSGGFVGGSHGGLGANGAPATHGNELQPTTFGDGGGSGTCGSRGGRGGGKIFVQATSIRVDGVVTADGEAAAGGGCGIGGGGGAGGSVWFVASGSFDGAGNIIARGGGGSFGGGGGRIKIDHATRTFSGILSTLASNGGGNGTTVLLLPDGSVSSQNGNVVLGAGTTHPSVTLLAGGGLVLNGAATVTSTVSVPAGTTLTISASDALAHVTIDALNIAGAVIILSPITFPSAVTTSGPVIVDSALTVSGDFTLSQGATLTHDVGAKNAAVNASGTFNIKLGSVVDITGKGLAQSVFFDPRTLTLGTTPPGTGGSHTGVGGNGPGAIDDPRDPVLFGDGGGTGSCGSAGGPGGGALSITAGTLRVDGIFHADGQNAAGGGCGAAGGGGAGGSIFAQVSTFTGGGLVTANGGQGGEQGGGGAIAVFYTTNTFTGSISARPQGGGTPADDGTVWLQDANGALTCFGGRMPITDGDSFASVTMKPQGTLEMNGGAAVAQAVNIVAGTAVELDASNALVAASLNPAIAGTLKVQAPIAIPAATLTGTLILDDALTVNGDLTALASSLVTHDALNAKSALTVTGTFDVRAGARVDANGKGLLAGPGAGFGGNGASIDVNTLLLIAGAAGGGGGGYGGAGGGATNALYGDPDAPNFLGAGGGQGSCGSLGGTGGGRLVITTGTLIDNGIITVSGNAPNGGGCGATGGGGAGGTIRISTGSLQGSGSIVADGGGTGSAGGGGGGRIRVDITTSGAAANTFTGVMRAAGGAGAVNQAGKAGTINVQSAASDTLFVEGGTYVVDGNDSFASVSFGAGGILVVQGPVSIAQTVQIPTGATIVLASSDALDAMSLDPTIPGTLVVTAASQMPDPVTLSGGTLVVDAQLLVPSLDVLVNGVVTTDPQVSTMDLVVAGALTLEPGAHMDVNGKGLLPAPIAGFGNRGATIDPITHAVVAGSDAGSGGSHAVLGGGATAAAAYDSTTTPVFVGGGGGVGSCGSLAAAGGGLIRFSASSLSIAQGALIVADGANSPGGGCGAPGGGGGGGTIVGTVGSLAGAGVVHARGGSGGQGGGGGVVVLSFADNSAFTGTVDALGGPGGAGGAAGNVAQVSATSPPTIVSVPPSTATVGRLVRYVAIATGSPVITWTLVSGPIGASLNAQTGELLWTPPDPTPGAFTIRADNPIGSDTQSFTLSPGAAPTITSTAATAAQVGAPYHYDASTSDAGTAVGTGPITWSAPNAPSGFTISPTTGVITWTPAVAGTFPACIAATNTLGSAQQCFSVVVSPPAGAVPPHITSTASTIGFVGSPYAYDADGTASADGDAPISWTVLLAPTNFGIDPSTGAVDWTPDTAGAVGVCIVASNDAGEDTQCFTVNVSLSGPPVFTSTPITLATQGLAYHYDIDDTATASGSPPIAYSAPTAPPGFTIDSTSGAIAWTPLQAGNTDVVIEATNAFGATDQSFTVSVLPSLGGAAPVIVHSANANAAVGVAYVYDDDGAAQAGGDAPITWSVVSAPTGFVIDPTTGLVAWTPDTAGQTAITIAATNDKGSDQFSFVVDVLADAGPSPTAVALLTPATGDAPLDATADGSQSFAPPGHTLTFFTWTWGDGSTPTTGASATHTYARAGSYVARLKVADELGATGETTAVARVSDHGTLPPTARILVSNVEGSDHLDVSFSCDCAAGDAPIEAFLWDFGDGAQSNAAAVTHTFGPGGFDVRLSVVDANGLAANDAVQIRVSGAGDQPPVAAISAAPSFGNAPLNVQFQASYADPDSTVASIAWDFGDGGTSTDAQPQYTYANAGLFTAKLEVTDDKGLVTSATVEVDVSDASGARPPQILSLPNTTGAVGSAYAYDDDGLPAARGDRPLTWSLGKRIGDTIVGAPTGMSIDANSGKISWTPKANQGGKVPVSLVAKNAAGAVVQDWQIDVSGGSTGPGAKPPAAKGCGCAQSASSPVDAAAGAFGVVVVALTALRRRRRR